MQRRYFTYRVVLFLLICFIYGQHSRIYAQTPQVRIHADSSSYELGDVARISIVIDAPDHITPEQPALKQYLQGGEILGKENPAVTNKNNSKSVKYVYLVSKYDSGDVYIPSFPVMYTVKGGTSKQQIMTQPLSVRFTALKVDDNAEIKDIKPPLRVPLDWKMILLYVLLGLALIALALYFYRRYMKAHRKIERTEPAVYKTPYQKAVEELELLRAKNLWQAGQLKLYYTEVTDIMRRYFESQYGIQALESTSDEFIEQVKSKHFGNAVLLPLSGFLNTADLVKFAKYIPDNQMNSGMIERAFEILSVTENNRSAAAGQAGGDKNIIDKNIIQETSNSGSDR